MMCLALATGYTSFAQTDAKGPQAYKTERSKEGSSDYERQIDAKMDELNALTARMKNAEDPKSLKKEIEVVQKELMAMRNKEIAELDSAERAMKAKPKEMKIFRFDPNERSLKLRKFDHSVDAAGEKLTVTFESPASGNGKIRLLNPGGLVFAEYNINNFGGAYSKDFTLPVSDMKTFYIHVEIDGNSASRKLSVK